MNRRLLFRKIAQKAKQSGLPFEEVAGNGPHAKWILDGLRISVPRHKVLNRMTAENIMKQLESKLGADWWR